MRGGTPRERSAGALTINQPTADREVGSQPAPVSVIGIRKGTLHCSLANPGDDETSRGRYHETED
jgi:hypothetical protein